MKNSPGDGLTVAGAEQDLNYAIIRVARRHRYQAGVLFADLGLHPGQEGVLHLLWERDGRSQAELAAALGIEPPTVHRTLTSLERSGLLRREPSPDDGRVKVVRLTDRGRNLRPDLASAWRELEARTVAGLSEPQRRTLLRLLARVAENLATERRLPPG